MEMQSFAHILLSECGLSCALLTIESHAPFHSFPTIMHQEFDPLAGVLESVSFDSSQILLA
jgi:S-adenosylmethionine/arginine decarboxylase-like enzyme